MEARKRTLHEAGRKGNFNPIARELKGELRGKRSQLDYLIWEEINYVVSIVQQSLYVVPTGVVPDKLDKFATSLPGRSATVSEAGVCLLSIREIRIQHLVP